MKLQKLTYVNGLHRRPGQLIRRILAQEAEESPEHGLYAEVGKLSKEYGFKNVAYTEYLRDDIVRTVKNTSYRQTWIKTLSSTKVIANWEPRTCDTWNKPWYFTWSKLEGKMMIAFRLGELELKTNRSGESSRLYGGNQCLVGVCGGLDNLDHVAECEGYTSRPDGQGSGDPKAVVNYLIRLNAERTRRWSMPLLYIRGW